MRKLFVFFLLMVGMVSARAQFSGGDGSASNPYRISTDWDLYNIRNYLGPQHINTHFKLVDNIDLTNFINQNFPAEGWFPIGNYMTFPFPDSAFMGKINGDGKTISGLWINRPERNYVGLFSNISNTCVIENLNIIVDQRGVVGASNMGALVGILKYGQSHSSGRALIRNCNIEGGLIKGNENNYGAYVGSIIGYATDIDIINCHSSNDVYGTGSTGGLIGEIKSAVIDSCSASGAIQVSNTASAKQGYGGLIGVAWEHVTVRNSHSTGNLTNNNGNHIGGLIGSFIGHIVENSYSTGNIINQSGEGRNIGGFIGSYGLKEINGNMAGIYRCYSTGNVEGGSVIGGFIGTTTIFDNASINGFFNIIDCYALGSVNAITTLRSKYVGGFMGWLLNNSVYMHNCYSAGAVENTTGNYIAGFLGLQRLGGVQVTYNCYYDQQTSGQPTGIYGDPNYVIGKTTAEMKMQSTFQGWDFFNTWKINEGYSYPQFKWQEDSGNISCFEGGDGTQDNPYQIKTPEQLDCLRNYVGMEYMNTYFKIIDNIDLSMFISHGHSPSEGWLPIGYRLWENTSPEEFMGKLDGGGYTISGLWINRPDKGFVGLFSRIGGNTVFENIHIIVDQRGITGASDIGALVGAVSPSGFGRTLIRNCTVEGGLISSNSLSFCVGGLIGNGADVDIINCHSSNDVSGMASVGGLIGQAMSVNIDFCSAIGNVQSLYSTHSESSKIGGLIGHMYSNSYSTNTTSVIQNSHSTGNVQSGYRSSGGFIGLAEGNILISNSYSTGNIGPYGQSVGGFIGSCLFHNYGLPNISKCYSTGNVDGHNEVGGFIGTALSGRGTIQDCYARGNVNAGNIGENLGGFIGLLDYSSSDIFNCYSTGIVGSHPSHNVAAFIGFQNDTYAQKTFSCYYDQQTANQPIPVNGSINYDIAPKNTIEMKQQSTYAGWDFGNIWKISNGIDYPVFQWQTNNQGYGIPFAATSYSAPFITNTPKNISVYPNPTTGAVTVEADGNSAIQIFDANGNIIITTTSKTIDLSSYSTGTYIFNINGETRKVFKK